MELNKYQTTLTEELLKSLSEEERDSLFDYINNVPIITRLIGSNRKYAKDLDRNPNGRIIVDIVNPHILENMDYFRPSAGYFDKHGVYTHLRPNGNPNSEFGKFMTQELTRCWDGYVRESDGEWIPGDLYFYWNYTPISLTRIKVGTNRGDRVQGFPEIWESTYLWSHYIDQARNGGLYNDFKGGQDAVVIARRGIGKSFFIGSILAKIFTIGESYEVKSNVKGMVTAYEKEYLNRDGVLNKFVSMIDFLAKHTQFPSARLKSSLTDMQWTMGYQDADTNVIKGTQNEVMGVSSKDNPDKIRGKRSHKMVYEEFGMFPKFLDTWTTSEYNVREGEYAFGQRLAIGTGGTEGSDFSGALELLNHPIGYNVYGIPNVFDKNSLGKTTTILFLGAYLNRKGYYNEDGVSDIIGALISEIKERTIVKYNSSDPNMITKRKAEMPITLQEAIMRRDSTVYPVSDLVDKIGSIDLNPKHYDEMWVGKLSVSVDGTVIYNPDHDVKLITDFPHKDNKLEGAICASVLPHKDSSGKVPWGRYIAGIDPYDDDMSTTTSLGALYILDLWTDELVFEYVGRPMFAEDFYENCRRALLMYNAECNYENNKKGLFTYFSKHSSLYLLSDTLEFLKDKDSMKYSLYGNKAKGTVSSDSIKSYSRRCIRDWLLKPAEFIVINADGDQDVTINKNLFNIPYRALLKELSMWNIDGNFDRHDALAMTMLLREDKLRLLGEQTPSEAASEREGNYLGNDPFFENNYGRLNNNY